MRWLFLLRVINTICLIVLTVAFLVWVLNPQVIHLSLEVP